MVRPGRAGCAGSSRAQGLQAAGQQGIDWSWQQEVGQLAAHLGETALSTGLCEPAALEQTAGPSSRRRSQGTVSGLRMSPAGELCTRTWHGYRPSARLESGIRQWTWQSPSRPASEPCGALAQGRRTALVSSSVLDVRLEHALPLLFLGKFQVAIELGYADQREGM